MSERYYLGALIYTDDLTLVVPSIVGLRKMRRYVGSVGRNLVLTTILPRECVWLSVGMRKVVIMSSVTFGVATLMWIDKVKPIGYHLECNLSETK